MKDPLGRSGSVNMMLALALVPAVLAVGAAVDYSSASRARAELQKASDAAALLAVRLSADKTPVEEARKRAQNMLETTGGQVKGSKIKKATVEINGQWTADAALEAEIPNKFLGLVGLFGTDVRATSRATVTAGQEKEIAFALDLTGSLFHAGLDDDLRKATKYLLGQLADGKADLGPVSVALVPFAGSVNVGTQHSSWLSNAYDPAAFAPSTWSGCVLGRVSKEADMSDAPPLTGRFDPYIWPKFYDSGVGYNDWHNQSAAAFKNLDQKDPPTTLGPNVGCPYPIVPLTTNVAQLDAAFASYTELSFNQGTNLPQALVWAWRSLSPKWKGLWSGGTSGPSKPSSSAEKTLIILTDGENEWWHDKHTGLNVTGYGIPETNRLNVPFDAAMKSDKKYVEQFTEKARGEMNARTGEICKNIKASGIRIVTIAFNVGKKDAIDLISSCASSSSDFYNPKNYNQLSDAFASIVKKTKASDLRLSR